MGSALLGILATGGVLPLAALAAVFAPSLVLLFIRLNQEWRVVMVLVTIAAPVSVPLLGKNGGTVTTFLIFFLALLSLIDAAFGRLRLAFRPVDLAIVFLMLVGLAGLAMTSPDQLLNGFRFYYIFLSGLVLFLLIIKSAPGSLDERTAYVSRLLNVLIVAAVIQIAVGLLVYFVPASGGLFKFFLSPTAEEGLVARVTTETVRRLTTLITGPEPTGEMLAVFAPLVLHKYFHENRALYLWVFLAMAGAEVLTATRSSNTLFVLATLTVIYVHSARIQASKVFTLLLTGCAGIFLILFIRPDFADGLITRFATTQVDAEGTVELSLMLNRRDAWAAGMDQLKELLPFGHGFARVQLADGSTVQFHSLYLTSLYQLGWVGAPVFFGFLIYLLWRLWISSRRFEDPVRRSLAFCSFVALSVFMVNEIKYEFNRHEPYLQFCWSLIGVFYLIAAKPGALRDRVPPNERQA